MGPRDGGTAASSDAAGRDVRAKDVTGGDAIGRECHVAVTSFPITPPAVAAKDVIGAGGMRRGGGT